MTEAEKWLEIGEKCVSVGVRDRGWKHIFLCNEADRAPRILRKQMRERLDLFEPTNYVGSVWWGGFSDGDETYSSGVVSLNNQRALACCFLAVMAEEDERR